MDSGFTEAGYEALLQDIFQRFPSVQKVGFTTGAYKPGLERMLAFDQALGCPSKAFRSIHVAGTNGKGSVANMLASALQRCGYQTGLFTSPHLVDFRERIRVAGQMIPKEYVLCFLQQWLPWIEEHQLSFFEITTGLAFQWFADEHIPVAVIETGLGGRLDSTNILTPELAIVTSIGMDHCQLLGNTLAQIAGEKAGIFKQGVPALVGESHPETAPVFEAKAQDFCSLFYAERLQPSQWADREAILQEMDLKAPVQEHNLRTVLVAVDLLKKAFPLLQNQEAVKEGIVHTAHDMDFHGRWERLSSRPYVLADIGHNAHALQSNFQQLQQWVDSGQFSSLILVYGIMADKDLDAILPLMPQDATYIFTAPASPRSLPAKELLSRFQAYQASGERPSCPLRAFATGSVRKAVQMAVQLAQDLSVQLSRSASAQSPAPPLIYIGGSNFVVAEALPLFR